MSRPVRILSLVLSLMMGLLLANVGTATVALAAARPVVSAVGSGAGPIKPTKVVITGQHLNGATAVRFAGKNAPILRRVSSTSLEVRTPKGMKAGRVSVRIRTAAGWSRATTRARYTFVALPRLTKVSPASGRFTGGQRVTLTGKNLKATKTVLFGTLKAAIVSRTAAKVVVTTPVGVLGKTAVTVRSAGGKSGSRAFTYVRPPREAAKVVTPVADTYVPAAIEWVTGGYNDDTGAADPWVVSLPQGAAPPEVGKPFLLKPGNALFPSGLAGTVNDVAVQVDESVRVSVAPTDLEKSLQRLSIDATGPLTFGTSGLHPLAVEPSTTFPIDESALSCKDTDGRLVAFGADLTMAVSDVEVSQHLDLGSAFSRPKYDGAFTAEVKTTGKFHGDAAAKCELRPSWVTTHKRIVPIGTTGLTVAIAPAFEFSVTGKGTLTLTDRTRTTYSVSSEYGKQPKLSKTSRTVESKAGGALAFKAVLTGGISVQFGVLDRAGVEAKALVVLTLGLTVSSENICVDGKIILSLKVGLFLDVLVRRWNSRTLNATVDLYEFSRKCLRSDQAPPAVGEPQITSARLPDSQIGTSYSTTLATADNRNGRWSIVRSALPAGLSLDANSGQISGTPTGPVGDTAVIINFTDANGRVATTTIRIKVLPSTGIGGGDIQITLRWNGPADLDLHVVDPATEEIYYRHKQSASGGSLDHDANAGCNGTADDDNAVENVFWPPRSAPAGSYAAWVKVYAQCAGPLDWQLEVRRNGTLIINESGTGDSAAYNFTVGANQRVRAMTRPAPERSYPAKP